MIQICETSLEGRNITQDDLGEGGFFQNKIYSLRAAAVKN